SLYLCIRRPPRAAPFPYTTLFRSHRHAAVHGVQLRWRRLTASSPSSPAGMAQVASRGSIKSRNARALAGGVRDGSSANKETGARSEEHTSELQSRENLVCRLLLEK